MQLTCHINQAEAIRRGHNANSSVKLEIDPSTLTETERETLACAFDAGEFKHSKYIWHQIPEPTVEGLREKLGQIAAEKAAANAKEQAKLLAFQARFDTEDTASMITINRQGIACIGGRDNGYASLRADQKAIADTIITRLRLEQDARIAEEYRLKTITDEARAAFQKERQEAEQQATETLRQWALADGSETLRLRTEEGFEWRSLAEKQWADAMLAQAGITEPIVPDMDGYTPDEDDCTTPTADEIKKLRRFREALKTSPKMEATVELQTRTYTKVQDEQYYYDEDTEKIVRNELKVTVNGPARGEVRYYLALD